MSWGPRAAALLCLPVLAACPAPPEIHWEGEHLRLGSEDPAAVCEGSYVLLDARAGALKARLGVTDIDKIDYYWVPSGAEPYCAGSMEVLGCHANGTVFAEWLPVEHELVHAVVGDIPPVMSEAIATHWGDPWPLSDMAPRDTLEAALRGQGALETYEEYTRGAHFMAFLSETHGPERLPELLSSLDGVKTKNMSGVFSQVYGQSLDELLAAYTEYPDCSGNVDVSLACAGEPHVIPLGGGGIDYQLDCDDARTIGPANSLAFSDGVLEMPSSIGGSRVVSATSETSDRGFVVLRRCGPCSERGVSVIRDLDFIDEADLPPGRYYLRAYMPTEDLPATLNFHITG